MNSSEELEMSYFQYQAESLPSGESVQSFCKRNKVPCNIYKSCTMIYVIMKVYYMDLVKLHGSSVWDFIGTFFKNIFNGCRDYVDMDRKHSN